MGNDRSSITNRFMNYLTVKNESELRIVQLDLLLAIEVNDYVCTFYLENGTCFSCVQSLKNIHEKLQDYAFIRISRKCLINPRYIQSIDFKRKEVKLSGDRTFGFSVRNAKALKQMFK